MARLLLQLLWIAGLAGAQRRTKLQLYLLNQTTSGSLPSTCGDGSPAGFFSSALADDEGARADALLGELKVIICKRS